MIFLSDKQVAERYGVNRVSIWRWIKTGDFPKPMKLSEGCTRWALTEVEAWEAKRLETRQAEGVA